MFGLRPWLSELECFVRGRAFALDFHVQPDYQVGAGMSGVKPSGLSLDIWSEAVRSEVVWSAAACLSARPETEMSSLNLEVWSGAVPVQSGQMSCSRWSNLE